MKASSTNTSYEASFVDNDTTKLAKMDEGQEDEHSCLYNSRTGECFGRQWTSFWKTAAYLTIVAASIAGFFGLCLWVFYQTLDNYTPKLQTSSSFIGTNPGLGYRPMRQVNLSFTTRHRDSSTSTYFLLQESNPYSSLIWFRHGAGGDWPSLKDNLDAFLAEYEPGYWANQGSSQTKCDFEQSLSPLNKDEACEFNKEWLSDQGSDIKCISEEHYGYYFGKPCLLLKLNRVYGWQPEPYYNITQVDNHPDMPKDLKRHIRKTWEDKCKDFPDRVERCPQLNMVWLHCDGEMDPDKENIGSVTYTPWRGFPGYFFPYYNQLGYLQPVVMVQLKNPTPGVLINIQCTAWANFIDHDSQKMRGSVHLEFLMD